MLNNKGLIVEQFATILFIGSTLLFFVNIIYINI